MSLQEIDNIAFTAEQQTSREGLALLFQISMMLDQHIHLERVIQPILNTLVENLNMMRGAITLLNRNTGEILIEASCGLSYEEKNKGRYKLGEGITGKVVASGEPKVIPNIANEPQFLDKTGARQFSNENISFICVPIKIGSACIGALSIDEPYTNEETMTYHMKLMSITASLISQAVRLRQNILEEHARLKEENYRLQSALTEKYRPSNILGSSAAMQKVFDSTSRACLNHHPVLIQGEPGTGKRLVASAIHYSSKNASYPYRSISCIAIPEEILEEELFGYKKNAVHRPSRIKEADNGTLLIIELAEASLQTQSRLLRFLKYHTFEECGSNQTVRSNTRIIATSCKNLDQLLNTNQFNHELIQTLSSNAIYMPPLRERKDDIPLLANHFIEIYAEKHHKDIARISTEAINMLMSYHWPGNISELESCIERGILMTNNRVIHPHHLPPTLQTAENTNTVLTESLDLKIRKLEKDLILDALKISRGSLSRASKILQITERVLGLRIKKHNINIQMFR